MQGLANMLQLTPVSGGPCRFVESVRAFPLIPSTTESIVSNLINAATTERACAMVDLVPHEHVGYATAIVSHGKRGSCKWSRRSKCNTAKYTGGP
jgi:hypothetical protein